MYQKIGRQKHHLVSHFTKKEPSSLATKSVTNKGAKKKSLKKTEMTTPKFLFLIIFDE